MQHQQTLIVNSSDSRNIYEQKQLETTAIYLDFPTDRVRSISSKPESEKNLQNNLGQDTFIISQEITQNLKNIAREKHTPLANILLGAFQVLLYRYTNQEKFVVGYLDLDNDNSETSLKILPVQFIAREELKFADILKLIQTQITTANNYLDLDSLFSIQNLESQSGDLADGLRSQILFRFCSLSSTSYDIPIAPLPNREIFLDIQEKSQCLICRVEYARHLFDESTIKRISDNYQVLLDSIIADLDRSITSLPLLSATETQQVLIDWNQIQVTSSSQPIHQLFAAQVAHNPEAIALICQGEALTYRELNRRANQVAHYLRSVGVTKGSLVGLCIERSLLMVVGVLGILKAEAAYVPLDISNPTARIAFIIEDAQIQVLLTQNSLTTKIPGEIAQTVCLDRDWQAIAEQPSENLPQTVTSNDLAHIVYTSGSTGKPKGVMLTHGNLSHYAQSLQLAFKITPQDTYLHRGSIALIVSARQLLMPLACGATAVIVSAQETKDPLELFALIKRHQVTIVDHVPSFWRNFSGIINNIECDRREDLLDNQVRLVAAGGEQVTPEIYQCWREIFKPEVQLANIYGQTEGTGVVTVFPIPDSINCNFKSLPVGRPIPNMRVYLLDQHLQPVPIGTPAEIHISGAGVASGYLNRPELTEAKFIPNPFVPGEKLYKTGDLGRYLADGSIQFLGRVDRQVNLQGLRIELGEIEAVLAQHTQIQEAAVVVRHNNLGETLAAFLVASPKGKISMSEIRSYLEQKLPTYMIPATFTWLEKFPQTTSGKIDYRALATIENISNKQVVAPRDRLETEIIEMLQEILGINNISITDNFAELGGNSLLAARLVTEIANRYQQHVAIAQIYQAETLEQFAQLVRQGTTSNSSPCFVPIKKSTGEITIFGIHNLGYGLEFYQPIAKHLPDNIALHGLSSFFSNEADLPHPRDILGLAKYYAQELLQIQRKGAYHLLGVSFGGVVAYETAQQLLAQGHQVAFLGMVDTFCPDRNSVRKYLSLTERFQGHLGKIRTKGFGHIVERIGWRKDLILDNIRAKAYEIEWVKDKFVDASSRNFDRVEYLKQTREHQQVNQNYTIQPYPGEISFFRAADDMDSKLDWQQLALGGLSIYDISGEHLEVLQEPNVQVLARQIKLALSSKF